MTPENPNDKLVSKRYVAWSKNFIDFIEKLGYVLLKSEGHNTQKKILYKTKDQPFKYIEITFDYIRLYTISEDGKEIEHYKGLTVHDELVIFFTKRNLKKL